VPTQRQTFSTYIKVLWRWGINLLGGFEGSNSSNSTAHVTAPGPQISAVNVTGLREKFRPTLTNQLRGIFSSHGKYVKCSGILGHVDGQIFADVSVKLAASILSMLLKLWRWKSGSAKTPANMAPHYIKLYFCNNFPSSFHGPILHVHLKIGRVCVSVCLSRRIHTQKHTENKSPCRDGGNGHTLSLSHFTQMYQLNVHLVAVYFCISHLRDYSTDIFEIWYRRSTLDACP
jgi:hypothetical protein